VLLLHYADADAAAGVVVAAAAVAAAGGAEATQFAPAVAFAGGWQPEQFPVAAAPEVVVTAGLCIKFDAAAVVVAAAVAGVALLWAQIVPVTVHPAQSTATVGAPVAATVAVAVAVAAAGVDAGAAQIHEHPLFQCTAPLLVVDMYLRTNVPPHESVTHSCLRLQLIL
jgi:hypothetical protein